MYIYYIYVCIYTYILNIYIYIFNIYTFNIYTFNIYIYIYIYVYIYVYNLNFTFFEVSKNIRRIMYSAFSQPMLRVTVKIPKYLKIIELLLYNIRY